MEQIDPKEIAKKNQEWAEHFKALGRGDKKPGVDAQPAPLKPQPKLTRK